MTIGPDLPQLTTTRSILVQQSTKDLYSYSKHPVGKSSYMSEGKLASSESKSPLVLRLDGLEVQPVAAAT